MVGTYREQLQFLVPAEELVAGFLLQMNKFSGNTGSMQTDTPLKFNYRMLTYEIVQAAFCKYKILTVFFTYAEIQPTKILET